MYGLYVRSHYLCHATNEQGEHLKEGIHSGKEEGKLKKIRKKGKKLHFL